MCRTLCIAACALALACSGPEGSSPADCDDGVDQDKDGLVDCEDDGCAGTEKCQAQIEEARRAEVEALAARSAANVKAAEEKAAAEAAAAIETHFDLDGLWVQKHHNDANINFKAAEEYCQKLVLADKDDWRLPTEDEAVRAARSGKLKPEPYVMWTSTSRGPKDGVIVGITSGAANVLGLRFDGDCRARCVRGK